MQLCQTQLNVIHIITDKLFDPQKCPDAHPKAGSFHAVRPTSLNQLVEEIKEKSQSRECIEVPG